MRGGVGLAVAGERRDELVHCLVRQDLTNGEDRGALVGELARDPRVRRTVEIFPVDQRGDDRGVRETDLFKLHAVVLAVGDPELSALREVLELLASDLSVALEVVIKASEVR